jgi:hypothetical protein
MNPDAAALPTARACFRATVVGVLLAGGLATSDVAARVTRLRVEGDDWSCAYVAWKTPLTEQLLLQTCALEPGAPSHFLFDWRDSFVALPGAVRSLSADARWAVSSAASMGDGSEVLLHDLQHGGSTRVTTTALGQPSLGSNFGARMTADGARVLFTSAASDLLPPGAGSPSVLEWQRQDASLVLRAADAQLLESSADGDVIVVARTGTSQPRFTLLQRGPGREETYCVAGASVCEFLGLSPDGRWLAYAHAVSGEPLARVLRDRAAGVDFLLPGFVRGLGHVLFDQASQQVAYDAPVADAPGGHGLRLRQLVDGSEQAVFFDRPVRWWDSPAAFGPDRLLAVASDTTVIVSLDTVFEHGFD